MANKDRTTEINDGEGLEIAHPEDFGISRDDEGNLVSVKQQVPETNFAIKCIPLVEGAVERWDDVLESDTADDDRTDEFLKKYVEEGIGQDGLSSCPDYLVPAVIEAVKKSSGYEVFQDMRDRQQERQMKIFETLDNVPQDLMMKVMGMDKEELEERTEEMNQRREEQQLHDTIGK